MSPSSALHDDDHSARLFTRPADLGVVEAEALIAQALRAAHWDMDGPARVVDRVLRLRLGAEPDDAARRAEVGRLALSLPGRLAGLALPASVRVRYADVLLGLSEGLARPGPYPRDDYAKDVRLVVGASVPAGAQLVDLNAASPTAVVARRVVRHSALALRLLAAGDLTHAAQLVAAAQARPWLQHHTDSRRLEEFDEPGWLRFYRTAAELLEGRPDAAGIFGASWFYDPQIVTISPKLAYLQQTPLRHGALHVRLPTDAGQIAHAVNRSPTRRRLYEEGRYRPACHAIMWPRAELLAWADRGAD